MSTNVLVALGILALVLQQLAGIFDKAAQWKTLSVDDRRALIVKVVVILLGIVGAEALMLNIIPVGTFDAGVSPFVLQGLSGILAGFGYDVAVGAIKFGGSISQAAGGVAQGIAAKGKLAMVQAESAVENLKASQAAKSIATAPSLYSTQVEAIVDAVLKRLATSNSAPPIPHSATASADDALIGLHG